jgi:cyclophilin family peptidyl-prolyl cis-trans isomerase
MKWLLNWLAAALLGFGSSALAAENPHGLPDGLYTEITTERGVVVCELFYQKTPLTVASYVGLAEGSLGPLPRKPFFEGLKWHRVVPGFVVQGGDPTGTGEGGPGYEFPDEIVPGLRHDSSGVLQMANDGPDSNGSQYCLMLSPQPRLNYLHTVFGHVVRGLDVLPQIRQGDTMRVKILRLGAAAQAFKADEASFATLLARAKAHRYQGPREPGTNALFADPDKILPTDWPRAQAFNFKLANFERFTGGKIIARVFARSPAPEGDRSGLEAWTQSEAARLGVAQRGVLAVYIADEDRWQVFIGTNSVTSFARTGPLGEAIKQKISPAQALENFLAAARLRSDEALAHAQASATPDKPLPAGYAVKLKVDAVLDGLIFKLEPH